MKLRKVADMVIYRDDSYYAGPGPAAVAFPDGEALVFFRRHRTWPVKPLLVHAHPSTEQCCLRSRDGGETWEAIPRVFAGGGGNAPCVALLSDGALLLAMHRHDWVPKSLIEQGPGASYSHRGDWVVVFAGTEVWRSEDRGEHWEGPFWVDDVPGLEPEKPGLHAPVGIRGPAVELADGTLGLPVYSEPGGPVLVVSDDGGRSWHYRAHVASWPQGVASGYNEWAMHQTPCGDLVAFIRCELREGGSFGHLHTARSSDGGRTWSAPKREEPWGYPHHVLRMPSGWVLLSYGYRREPYGVRCRLIDPECRRIGEAEELVLRADGGHWDLGYPDAALLPDGRALVVYYFCDRPDGQRYIAGSVVEVC
jgi:hypothetical protein